MAILQRINKLKHRAFKVSALGASWWSKIGLYLVYFYSLVMMKWGRKAIIPARLALRYHGSRFVISFKHPVDIFILEEIFIDNEYALSLSHEPQTIVDLGGSIGLSAIYFALTYPKATIHVYEPDPMTFAELKRNAHAFPTIKIFNMMVNDTRGPTTFYISPTSVSSSKVQRSSKHAHVTVQGTTFDALIQETKAPIIDIVKFDIEGAEYGVFKVSTLLKNVDCFIGELHADLIDVSKETFLQLFEPHFDIVLQPISSKRFKFLAHRKK